MIKKQITVVLADDHPVARAAFASVLNSQADFAVVGEADRPSALLRLLEQRICDVVLTDLSLSPDQSEGDGLSMLAVLHQRYPSLPLVVTSMYDTPALVRAAFAMGATAFVSKRDVAEHVVHAVRAALRRQRYLAPIARPAYEKASRRAKGLSQPAWLTDRESHVLQRYLEGASVTDIAAGLGRSAKTVSAQRSAAMRKLWVANDADLFELAAFDGIDPTYRGTPISCTG